MDNNTEIKDFLDKSIKKNSIFNRVLSIVTVCALIIGIYALLNRQNALIDKNQQLSIKTDSLEKVMPNRLNEDSIRNIIFSVINTNKTEETIKKYYAPILKRYYLDSNLTVEQCISKWKNNNQTSNLKKQKVLFKNSDIEINYSSLDTNIIAVVLVKTFYSPDTTKIQARETIYQIKINSRYKIFSIRNLLPLRQ